MSQQRTYLDWNATAPLRAEARAAMLAALDVVGNASSPHAEGRRARALIEGAREAIAAALRVKARHVYFTSGATEAANWLLTPNVQRRAGRGPLALLLAGATEHAAILNGHRFPAAAVELIPVDGDGLIELGWLEARLAEAVARHGAGAVMVAVQAANNETGVVQPLARLGALTTAAGALFVCDAVQALGRAPVDSAALGSGALILSGHKLGGPQGIGAAIVLGEDLHFEPLLRGGGQERRLRSGTENIVAIAGLAAAVVAALSDQQAVAAHGLALQQRFEQGLSRVRGDAVVFAAAAPRLANTTCFALPGIAAETALIALDLAGVAVSSGSACSSGKVARSHVLEAMQVEAGLASAALRLSSGRSTGLAQIDACLAALAQIERAHARRHPQPAKPAQRKVA